MNRPQDPLHNQELQQIRVMISSNIITITGFAVLYGVFELAGEYLITFIFMIISAIALNTIKNTLVVSLQEAYSQQQHQGRIFILHLVKFSLISRTVRLLGKIFSEPIESLLTFIGKLYDSTLLPYLFLIYIFCFKLQLHFHIVLVDLLFWLIVDIFRLFGWMIKRLKTVIKGVEEERIEENRVWLVNSPFFNQILFFSLVLFLMIMIPATFIFVYSDIMAYKEELMPLVRQLNITQYQEYVSPEFMLSKLEGNYISEDLAKQLYSLQNNDYLQIFYGDETKIVQGKLQECQESKFCQLKVFATNLDLLNSEFYEYFENGSKYVQQILPQIRSLFSLIFKVFADAFEGSMGMLFKIMLYQQGVLYLLNSSSVRVSDVIAKLIIFKVSDEFKKTLLQNVNKHITGVFVTLTLIFVYHFMLSYILLDVIGIQLAFVISLLVGIFSLTQIVSPGVFFLLITALWYGAGMVAAQLEVEYRLGLVAFLVINAIFFILSGNIYSTCFTSHLGDPFWTGISIILGYISFQWKGIVFGPLLIGAIRTIGEVVIWYAGNEKQPEVNDQQTQQQQSKKQQKKQKSKLE